MPDESKIYHGQVSEHALIFNEFGEVLLLIHAGRGNPIYRGKYHLPGGRMDTDDVPGEGLLREIAEETGIQGVELILPCSATRWGPVMPGFGIKYSVTYLAKIKGRPTPQLPDDEDHMGAEWVPYEKALAATFTFPGVNEAVRQTGEWAKKLGVLKHA